MSSRGSFISDEYRPAKKGKIVPSQDNVGMPRAELPVDASIAEWASTLSSSIYSPTQSISQDSAGTVMSPTTKATSLFSISETIPGFDSQMVWPLELPDDESEHFSDLEALEHSALPVTDLEENLPAAANKRASAAVDSSRRASPLLSRLSYYEINCSLDVHRFSTRKLACLKQIADLMTVRQYYEEACEIYTLLLKRCQSDQQYRSTSYWHLVTQIVYTARQAEHGEIARSILQPRLHLEGDQETQQDPFLAFNRNMFQAFCSVHATSGAERSHAEYRDAANNCLKNIRTSALQDDYEGMSRALGFKTLLPENDRSLDLAFFWNVWALRWNNLDSPKDFAQAALNKLVPNQSWEPSQSYQELELLRCVPGPFEVLPDGTTSNPCIRSCLEWCARQLKELAYVPVMLIEGIRGTVHEDAATAWAVREGLFKALWECWRGVVDETDIWTAETEKRMGISSCELLFIVCACIQQKAGYDRRPILQLSNIFHAAALELLLESNEDLCLSVLRQYVTKHARTKTPSWLARVLATHKRAAFEHLERILDIRISGLSSDVCSHGGESRRVSGFYDLPPHFAPNSPPVAPRNPETATLASSRGSTCASFSNFRSAGSAMDRLFEKLKRQTVSSNGSAGARGSRGVSLSEISDMSGDFEQYMRLAPTGNRFSGVRESILDEAEECTMDFI